MEKGHGWQTVGDSVPNRDADRPPQDEQPGNVLGQEIVLVILVPLYDERSITWACRPENWDGLASPAQLPSQSTVSRRSRTDGKSRRCSMPSRPGCEVPCPTRSAILAVDGRPLHISPFSKDPDAHWGYAIKGLGFGYKLHAIWGTGPFLWLGDLLPLNANESRVAAANCIGTALPAAAGKRYLWGTPLMTPTLVRGGGGQGFQLVAPPKHLGVGLGHRRHHPARVSGSGLAANRLRRTTVPQTQRDRKAVWQRHHA